MLIISIYFLVLESSIGISKHYLWFSSRLSPELCPQEFSYAILACEESLEGCFFLSGLELFELLDCGCGSMMGSVQGYCLEDL